MKDILKVAASPFASLIGAITPKKPKLPAALPGATRDEAREAIIAEDRLRKRRGGAADILTGTGGAEAGAGGKDLLGS